MTALSSPGRARARTVALLVLAAALLGLACSSEAPQTLEAGVEDAPASKVPSADPLSARLEMQTSMAAGEQVAGNVIVTNETGSAVTAEACGSPYSAALRVDGVLQQFPSLLCAHTFTIPAGESRWPVVIVATYAECPPESVAACAANGAPPLPPGTYEATFFAAAGLPVPPPAEIVVTATP